MSTLTEAFSKHALTEEKLEEILITLGWTPPPEKEPEFKPGDYVEYYDDYRRKWVLSKYHHYSIPYKLHMMEDGNTSKTCRPAPTWIKWEDGEAPNKHGPYQATQGVVFPIGNRLIVSMGDGRWAWMPEEETS